MKFKLYSDCIARLHYNLRLITVCVTCSVQTMSYIPYLLDRKLVLGLLIHTTTVCLGPAQRSFFVLCVLTVLAGSCARFQLDLFLGCSSLVPSLVYHFGYGKFCHLHSKKYCDTYAP